MEMNPSKDEYPDKSVYISDFFCSALPLIVACSSPIGLCLACVGCDPHTPMSTVYALKLVS